MPETFVSNANHKYKEITNSITETATPNAFALSLWTTKPIIAAIAGKNINNDNI
jgi:hypothetical protein